ncbi:MAG TPA: tyrosinase family protein [Solirubrobacterales bacterium]
MRPDQLEALRDAFAAIKKLQDTNGFWFWAELHGAPKNKCEHSPRTGYDNLFLPWHRAYLYRLELALQTKVPAATLPWWDWPASRTSGGVPTAYEDIGGEQNPLAGADFPPRIAEFAAAENMRTSTWREPGDPRQLPSKAEVDSILELKNFDDFSKTLEVQLHNRVHGWVQGSMGIVALAAYDPLFWAHHTMVDRLWALWQTLHSSRGPRPGIWGRILRGGLDLTVGDVLDTHALGYDYAASTAHREVTA